MSRSRKLTVFAFVAIIILAANAFTPLRIERVSIDLKPESVFRIGGFCISNTLLGSWFGTLILVALAAHVSRKIVDAPSARSLQNIIEATFEALLDFMQGFVGSKARVFFPVVCTLFLFILTSNWLGLLPGFGSIGFWKQVGDSRKFVPLLRGSTSDLNTTLALAICSVVSSQVYGIRYLGFFKYMSRFVGIGKFIAFFRSLAKEKKTRFGLLFGGILDIFIGILGIFEELTKTLSFSFRLFGNVFGGEVLLAIIAFLVPYVISIPFLALEIFVGFIQAFIFAVLSTAFFGQATSRENGGDAEERKDSAPLNQARAT